MAKQKTLAKECIIRGIGLHTGDISTLVLKPAPADTGIVFIKTKAGNLKIEAVAENVTEVKRGTTISKGEESVSTIEHLLATLSGFGLDNLIVEIDSNELPILDGSAKKIVEHIKEAGVIEQEKEAREFELPETVVFETGRSKYIAIPDDKLKLSCMIEYDHPLLNTQYNSFEINQEIFINELSSARTFCFDYEIELLREKGLARGGSLENAIVIGEKKIHTKELKYKDEFVRHKMLDMLGDFYLIGGRLKAHIFAVRPGHRGNVEFIKYLKTKIRPVRKIMLKMGPAEIKKNIPHRYPFLFVDKVDIYEGALSSSGYKNLTANEFFFRNDKNETLPLGNVFLIEMLAQTACVLFLSRPDISQNKLALFMGINYMKFYKSAYPGDLLRLEVEVIRPRAKGGKAKGIVYSGNTCIAESEFMFALIDKVVPENQI